MIIKFLLVHQQKWRFFDVSFMKMKFLAFNSIISKDDSGLLHSNVNVRKSPVHHSFVKWYCVDATSVRLTIQRGGTKALWLNLFCITSNLMSIKNSEKKLLKKTIGLTIECIGVIQDGGCVVFLRLHSFIFLKCFDKLCGIKGFQTSPNSYKVCWNTFISKA